jgi:thymidylate synthase (FAD)
MNEEVKILDHGFLKPIDVWGSDERVIESARMSTGKGFLGWGPKHSATCVPGMGGNFDDCSCGKREPGDEKLLRFLWENKHSTPFEMAGMTIEVQAPIFVFREWHRHRVPFGYSEMSARYTPLPDLNYVPTIERLMVNSKTNKQAGTVSGAEELTEESAAKYIHELRHVYEVQQVLYEHALKIGVPKELARIHLPVGRYSRMRATSNLRGWLAFLALRMAPGAQYEIRVYANAVGDLIQQNFPRTWELFAESKGAS